MHTIRTDYQASAYGKGLAARGAAAQLSAIAVPSTHLAHGAALADGGSRRPCGVKQQGVQVKTREADACRAMRDACASRGIRTSEWRASMGEDLKAGNPAMFQPTRSVEDA
jgi:hypothetical protein